MENDIFNLNKDKKAAMRSEILAFVRKNPLPVKKPFFGWPRVAMTAFSLMAMAGLVSASAGSALPGDILYPVKINVNERIMQALAVSEKQKADLNLQLANTRLQEIEKVSLKKGKVPENIKKDVVKSFEKHADELTKSINELSKKNDRKNAADIAESAKVSLKEHSNILGQLKKDKQDDFDGLPEKIDQTLNNVSASLDKSHDVSEKENGNKHEKEQDKITSSTTQAPIIFSQEKNQHKPERDNHSKKD